jgi:hypothetical protein
MRRLPSKFHADVSRKAAHGQAMPRDKAVGCAD